MEKSYILKGDPKEVEKVIRENRIRVNRGVISFTPVEPEAEKEEPIDAPDEGETDNNSGENIPVYGNIDGENIPQQPEEVEIENTTENTEQRDDKILEMEDMKEIDLDSDDKTLETDDSKDVPAPDTKKTEAAKKTSKRSAKSE